MSGTTWPIETKTPPVKTTYAISSAVSKMVTSGDLGDLQRSNLRFRLLHPYSITQELLSRSKQKCHQSIQSKYAITSAISKMVTSGDLGDLQRSTLRFRLLHPFYNSGTTGPIEMKRPPVDSAYAISPAVSKMVTSGDLGDLQRSTLRFRL